MIDDLSGKSLNLLYPSIKVINLNARDRKIESLIKDSDLIIDLASTVGVESTSKNFFQNFKNIEKALNLEKINRKYNKPLIYTSTSDIYGLAYILEKKFKENTPMIIELANNRWVYSKIKSLEEDIYLNFTFNLVIRIFNSFGFGVDFKKPDRLFAKITHSIIYSQPLVLYGDGNQKRCFTYIQDTVSGFYLALKFLEKNQDQSIKNIFNIGNPKNLTTIKKFAQLSFIIAKKMKLIKEILQLFFIP